MSYKPSRTTSTTVALAVVLAACGGAARLPISKGIGPTPELPSPEKSLIPTMKVQKARGWNARAEPTASAGLAVQAFAMNLEHPRFLYVLPNGDVLVSESNGPPRPEDNPKGIRG